MVNKNTATLSSRERILAAARQEFASSGFDGARMERIAQKAGINKAMIFYYFSSKEKLYQDILQEALLKVFTPLSGVIASAEHPEPFLERIPGIYMRFFFDNIDFTRLVAFELVHHPGNITRGIRSFFQEHFQEGPGLMFKKIKTWYDKGWTTESRPLHFMLNIVSLSLLAFLARPIIEAVFDTDVSEAEFLKQRERSVINLLKQGMLK